MLLYYPTLPKFSACLRNMTIYAKKMFAKKTFGVGSSSSSSS